MDGKSYVEMILASSNSNVSTHFSKHNLYVILGFETAPLANCFTLGLAPPYAKPAKF